MDVKRFLIITAVALAVTGCGSSRKAEALRKSSASAAIFLPREDLLPELDTTGLKRDTLKVEDPDGREVLIMKAVRDQDGEMVATDVIDAAVITARFRNVAERRGKVDLRFQVTVPESMQDGKWQIRLTPDMYMLGDSVELDPVIITGAAFRRSQLRGYEHYRKFLHSIVTDSAYFRDIHQLEVFISRNIPALYAYRNDSTTVADSVFSSAFGVTEREAIDHYTLRYLVHRNDRRIADKERMFRKHVKVPFVSGGLKLDTVIAGNGGAFTYEYVQTVNTEPSLRKVGISLKGEIYEGDKRIYTIPRSDPLTYYISSLSSLADRSERYLTKVIERDAKAYTACYIDFPTGGHAVDEDFGDNRSEIRRISGNLTSLLEDPRFDLDSIIVTASCSPEGTYPFNERLSQKRAESVSGYFTGFIRKRRDSLLRAAREFNLDGTFDAGSGLAREIRFISRNDPENWGMLDALVRQDSMLTPRDKEAYALSSDMAPDEREVFLHGLEGYKRMREVLYPKLRTVKFDFHLHRKGMIKDTVHTTVIDSVYSEGVQALLDHDYEKAVTLLRPYHDYNSAVAFCAMDYNSSAMEILDSLEETAKTDYMMALIFARKGDDRSAVERYLRAVRMDPSFIHRGNLDPEISRLIKDYGLNKE